MLDLSWNTYMYEDISGNIQIKSNAMCLLCTNVSIWAEDTWINIFLGHDKSYILNFTMWTEINRNLKDKDVFFTDI